MKDIDETASASTSGRQVATERRRQRLTTAIEHVAAGRLDGSVSAVARAARVHRSFLYRHPDLLRVLRATSSTITAQIDPDERVSTASLRAELAHTRERAQRAEARVRELERRLSRNLGERAWEAAAGESRDAPNVPPRDDGLERKARELTEALDERDGELRAARQANRELMAQLNAATRGSPSSSL